MTTGIVAGWYRDPAEPDTQRYWDGEQWVGERLPADVSPPAGPLAPAAAVPAAPVPATPVPGAQLPAEPTAGAQVPDSPSTGVGRHVLATVVDRLAARLVDAAALAALNLVVNGWFVYLFVREIRPAVRAVEAGHAVPALSDQAGRLFLAIVCVAMALWFAYEVPAIASTGQTLGKRLVGLRVMTVDGKPVGFPRAIQRWAVPGLPMILPWPLGHLVQAVDAAWCLRDRPLRQCLHDKAAGTVVVATVPGEN